MKKKFAFLLMGEHYDIQAHQSTYETEKQITYICTLKNQEEACAKAVQLKEEGVGAIELCGAFGEQGAQQMIELTGGTVAVGYVTHFKEQDHLFEAFFQK